MLLSVSIPIPYPVFVLKVLPNNKFVIHEKDSDADQSQIRDKTISFEINTDCAYLTRTSLVLMSLLKPANLGEESVFMEAVEEKHMATSFRDVRTGRVT